MGRARSTSDTGWMDDDWQEDADWEADEQKDEDWKDTASNKQAWAKLQQELRRLGESWVPNTKGNEGTYRTQKEAVWVCLYNYYSRESVVRKAENYWIVRGYKVKTIDPTLDAVDKFMNRYFDRFDPAKGPLVNYCTHYMKRIIQSKQRIDPETGKRIDPKVRAPIAPISSSTPLGDDEPTEAVIEDYIPAPDSDTAKAVEEQDAQRIYFLALAAMVLNFKDLPGMKKYSQARFDYYRMWCAEQTVDTMRRISVHSSAQNEKDLIRAMDLNYLDFFMSRKVRKLKDLRFTPLKPTKAFEPDGSDAEIPWRRSYYEGSGNEWYWLPAKVPMKYRNVNNSTVSEQRENYAVTFDNLLKQKFEE